MANPLIGMMGNTQVNTTPAGVQSSGFQMPDMSAIKQAAQSAKRMMGMLQTVKDPQKALMTVAQQNPNLNEVLQLVGGRNPQEVFYEQCQKHGINPDIVLNELRS